LKQPVFLRVYRNGKLENVKQFTEEQVVIGRNTDVQICLDVDGISPLHAVIERRDTGYYVSDLGSETGTFRNGQKIFDEALGTGDEIQIGPFRLEFYVGVPKPKSPPPASVQPPVPTSSPVMAKLPEAPPPVTEVRAAPKVTATPLTKKAISPSAKGTYAPPSARGELKTLFRKSEGPVVEVVVAWKERIISTHHYSEVRDVRVGANPDCDISLPLLGLQAETFTLVKVGKGALVTFTAEMTGELISGDSEISLADLRKKGRVLQSESAFGVSLAQGEMIRLGLLNDTISFYVRYVPQTGKPIAAPVLDLTGSEATAVLMAVVMAVVFGVYQTFYSTNPLQDQAMVEEPIRKAIVTFKPPKPEIVPFTEDTQKEKKVTQVAEKKAVTTNKDPGQSGELRPNPQNQKTKQASSVVEQGGAKKTGADGANLATKKNRDVRNEGLLSVFGSKGTQDKLSQAYSGTGELAGLADSATGKAGFAQDREGDRLGSTLKNVGAGGKGTSTSGFAGVGTKGKGTGAFGYGSGGIGERGKIDINIEGAEAEFSGTIDREAIRRVIRENRRAFKNCYDQALRRNSDQYGRIEIQWDIVERGQVERAIVKSNSVGDQALGQCLVTKLRGLRFPEPPADEIARVVYPFVFAAQ